MVSGYFVQDSTTAVHLYIFFHILYASVEMAVFIRVILGASIMIVAMLVTVGIAP